MKSSQANSESQDVTGVTDSSLVTKRGFLRLTAAGVGASAVGVGSMQSERLQPVGRSEAGLPVLMVAGFGVGLATGYILEEHSDLLTGTDVEKEDLDNYVGADARLDEAYKAASQMESADDSVYTGMQNWLEDGWENAARVDYKIEVVQAIENGDSKQEVEDKALTVLDKKASVPEENFFDHFSEQSVRIIDIFKSLDEHSEISVDDGDGIFNYKRDDGGSTTQSDALSTETTHAVEHTLYNGDIIDIFPATWGGISYSDLQDGNELHGGQDISPFALEDRSGTTFESYHWCLENSEGDFVEVVKTAGDSGAGTYNSLRMEVWESLQQKYDDLEQEIILFVDELYDAYQSGDVDLDNVIGTDEFGEFASGEDRDGAARAAFEMAALGVSVEIEGGGTIRLEESNMTLDGFIGTRDDQFVATVGETYDPDTDISGDVYLALKGGTLTGDLEETEYVGSLDGGVFELEDEPFADTFYYVETVNDETATAHADDFEENVDGRWETDLSDDLEEPIADVEAVTFDEADASVSPDSIRVDEPFTILSYQDRDGNDVADLEFSTRNVQTTDTDVEALQEELAQMRELLDDWEDLEEEGVVGGGGGGWFDFEAPSTNVIVAAAAALGGGYLLTNNSDDST